MWLRAQITSAGNHCLSAFPPGYWRRWRGISWFESLLFAPYQRSSHKSCVHNLLRKHIRHIPTETTSRRLKTRRCRSFALVSKELADIPKKGRWFQRKAGWEEVPIYFGQTFQRSPQETISSKEYTKQVQDPTCSASIFTEKHDEKSWNINNISRQKVSSAKLSLRRSGQHGKLLWQVISNCWNDSKAGPN